MTVYIPPASLLVKPNDCMDVQSKNKIVSICKYYDEIYLTYSCSPEGT